MCFTFKKNNKWTKKPANRFLQDSASAGIRSLQTSIVRKLDLSYLTSSFFLESTVHLIREENATYR